MTIMIWDDVESIWPMITETMTIFYSVVVDDSGWSGNVSGICVSMTVETKVTVHTMYGSEILETCSLEMAFHEFVVHDVYWGCERANKVHRASDVILFRGDVKLLTLLGDDEKKLLAKGATTFLTLSKHNFFYTIVVIFAMIFVVILETLPLLLILFLYRYILSRYPSYLYYAYNICIVIVVIIIIVINASLFLVIIVINFDIVFIFIFLSLLVL